MAVDKPTNIAQAKTARIQGRREISLLRSNSSDQVPPLVAQDVTKLASEAGVPVPIIPHPRLAAVNHRQGRVPLWGKQEPAMCSFCRPDLIVRQVQESRNTSPSCASVNMDSMTTFQLGIQKGREGQQITLPEA